MCAKAYSHIYVIIASDVSSNYIYTYNVSVKKNVSNSFLLVSKAYIPIYIKNILYRNSFHRQFISVKSGVSTGSTQSCLVGSQESRGTKRMNSLPFPPVVIS